MGLETGNTVEALVAANPVGLSDTKSKGDDHIRLIKAVLKATFPGFSGAFNHVQLKTSAYTVLATDNGSVINTTGTWTLTLSAAATMGDGTSLVIFNNGAGVITVDPDSAETINGAATLDIPAGRACMLYCDGSNWLAIINIIAGDVAVLSDDNAFTGMNSFSQGIGRDYNQNLGFAASVASSALTVELKGQDGADPSSTNIVELAFRSATVTSITYNVRQVTGALSLVIPAGATLGIEAATLCYIMVYLLDNAGTPELAIMGRTNPNGILSEGDLVDTVVLDTSSDSFNVLYSTTARSDVPIRFIGMVEVTTGGTAGNWDNAVTGLWGDLLKTRRQRGYDFFTTDGTWTCPPGITEIEVLGCGGGGGGASGGNARYGAAGAGGGGGGGSSECQRMVLAAVPGTAYAVTIGTGGVGGAATVSGSNNGNDGSAGGDTTLGSLYTAAGGFGGSGGKKADAISGDVNGQGGVGGIGGGVYASKDGNDGDVGDAAATGYSGAGGDGADSLFGTGGVGGAAVHASLGQQYPGEAGSVGSGYGAGGGGSSGGINRNSSTWQISPAAADGTDGLLKIWW